MADERRCINKLDAMRHLVHAAIRAVFRGDDPFATLLIIHAAERLAIDYAQAHDIRLIHNVLDHVPLNLRKDFKKHWRSVYDYLRHANRQPDAKLQVHQIGPGNLLHLAMVCEQFAQLYGSRTEHVEVYSRYISPLLSPDALQGQPEQNLKVLQQMWELCAHRRVGAFLEDGLAFLDSRASDERDNDLQDIAAFRARRIGHGAM